MRIESKKKNNKIYNLNNGIIEVYNFGEINHRLKVLRTFEINKIPKEEQILREVSTRGWLTPTIKRTVFNCNDYVLQGLDFKKSYDIDKYYSLRMSYVYGEDENAVVEVLPEVITFIPNSGYSNYRIQLTEDAFIGFLLKNELFDSEFLQNKDLDRFKDYFEVSKEPKLIIPLDKLEEIYRSKIIPGSFRDTLYYLDGVSKVYKKIR